MLQDCGNDIDTFFKPDDQKAPLDRYKDGKIQKTSKSSLISHKTDALQPFHAGFQGRFFVGAH